MYDAIFPPASNRADWVGTFELIDDDTGDIVSDLAGFTVSLEVRADRCGRVLTGTTEDGHIILISGGAIQWSFNASQMRNLSAGTYEIGILIMRDGATAQQLIGSLPIVDGIVRP